MRWWLQIGLGLSLLAPACSFEGAANNATDDAAPQIDATPGAADATPLECGDGDLDGDEQCDDSNVAPGDGCDATCAIEPGFECAQGLNCTEVDDFDWLDTPAESNTSLGDSGGGGSFSRACVQGDVGFGFVGIYGTNCGGAGGGVARLELVCGDLDFDGAGAATAASTYSTAPSGVCNPAGTITAGQIDCPAGTVLVGVRGSTTDYLRELEGICRPLSLVGGALTYGDSIDASGALGPGAVSSSVECPAGEAVVGIGGNVGQVIDHLTIYCAGLASVP